MENPRNDIKKAIIKKDRLNVVYNERFMEANYTNVISKNCDQIVHSDLKDAFNRLKMHLVVLCEQPEGFSINKNSFNSPGFTETIQNYYITGYSNDSVDGISGITICGTKMLQSGKTVDLKIFVPFNDENYPFADELNIDAASCDEEVDQYLFSEKWGIKQEMLDFESDEPLEVNLDLKPKRKGRGKKKKEIEADDFAEAVMELEVAS